MSLQECSRRSRARKTGVPACHGGQASGLSQQPGTVVCRDSRDGCLPRPPRLHRQFLQGFRFLAALAALACAHAADLTATLETSNLRLRKDAPIPLEVRFQNPTPRLLEGRLEITLLLGGRKAGVHRSAELVLQPGARTVPLLIPPPPETQAGDGIAARLRWIGADGIRNLGEQRIGIYNFGGNEVVLAIARTERRLTDLDHARETSLRLESLRPALDAEGWLTFTTHDAGIAAQNLPTHPLGWCAYDAVFLDGPAFAATNEKQLTSLARWVEAGGSAGICTDAPLSERHAAFLNRLAASERPAVQFRVGENGNLARDGGPSSGATAPMLLRPGLGRAFVTTDSGTSAKTFDRNEWRAAVAWLWKLREYEQRAVAITGRWSKDFGRNNRDWRGPDEIELTAIWSAAAGFNALTPGAPRQMPLTLVALVLGTLLVIVGPADWFALGWLRRRRWTWIVFPIACAAFAWWTAHLAGRYLGASDRTGRVRLVDLGDDGRVLRELRYEMLLPARDREWSFDLHDAIAVPVPRNPFAMSRRGWTNYPPIAATPVTGASSNLAGLIERNTDSVSEWPSPSHFILRRTLRQWSPAMVRITSFADTADAQQPDWDAALAFFKGTANVETWNPGDAANRGFRFEIPKRDGGAEPSNRYNQMNLYFGGGVGGGDDWVESGNEVPVVRWLAFGRDAGVLGGLRYAVSPLLAGTSDLNQTREWSRDRRVLCAWRRAEGELLIYRRSFLAK